MTDTTRLSYPINNTYSFLNKPIDTNTGESPLHLAVRFCSLKEVKELLDHKADINIEDHHGWTPLHHLVTQADKKEVAQLLLNQGAKTETINNEECTPLHEAVRANKPPMVRLLLDHGAKIEAINKKGRTPLHEAVLQPNGTDLVQLLLDKGVKIEAKDIYGFTPLSLLQCRLIIQPSLDSYWSEQRILKRQIIKGIHPLITHRGLNLKNLLRFYWSTQIKQINLLSQPS